MRHVYNQIDTLVQQNKILIYAYTYGITRELTSVVAATVIKTSNAQTYDLP